MSDKFVDLIKEKMAETKKQREQDKGKPAPDFQINREPKTEEKQEQVKH